MSSSYSFGIYTCEVFTTADGSFTWTPPAGVTSYDVLVVAGGGSGGNHVNAGGGGGAGGLLWLTGQACTPGVGISGSVGAGGATQGTANTLGNSGTNSVFGSNTATGGGGGGAAGSTAPSGGSGGGGIGGASGSNFAGGAGTGGQGSTGGTGFGSASILNRGAGGGGGKGSVGGNASSLVGGNAGNGGTGYDASALLGTSVGDSGWFASGGGGGCGGSAGNAGTVSSGGGGAGGKGQGTAGQAAGTAGTGGGGGGGGGNTSGASDDGMAGGSGLIVVRYVPTLTGTSAVAPSVAIATTGVRTTTGTAAVAPSVAVATTGFLSLTGTAAVAPSVAIATTGDIVLPATVDVDTSVDIATTGKTTGSAAVAPAVAIATSGQLTGTSAVAPSVAIATAGQLTGTSAVAPSVAIATTGTLVLTGTADVAPSVAIATTGYIDTSPPVDTDTSNNVYAVMFSGDADVVWEPAVVARPLLLANGEAQISARKIDDYNLSTEGVATLDETVVSVPRHRDRILIGNTDWTFRHGLQVTVPDYELLEPFMYGDGGTLILPSINARYERLGVGRLKRVKLGAKVVYQRVDDDPTSPTYNEVVATDYKGLILRQGRRGDQLTLAVGGELLGRASLRWNPVPLFKRIRDAGVQLFNSVIGMGLRYHPRLQNIGIDLAARGGTFEDQYLLDTLAQLTTGDGDQWTVMPDSHGRYHASLKDRETINATVYLDNEFATEDLGDDLAEKPNRVWINAVAPDGQRIMHASAPLMQFNEVPERPLVDGGVMAIGDTDADTSTGDGVTVLVWRLTFAGLLDRDELPGGFDDDVRNALMDFQRSAGMIPVTGTVTEETWEALWDNFTVGYSHQFAAQRPGVEDDKVRKFDRSGSGSIIGRNDSYDETAVVVDLPLDMGPVGSRRSAFKMARHKLRPVGDEDWVGTISLTSGLIAGEHNPGDPLVEADIIPNRAVRPGWNLWVPYFGEGDGTLFHVVACRVSDNGWVVEVVVDTRARDAMEAWAVHTRNRENRYQPSRYLGGDRRRSTAALDVVTPWDKIVGQTDRVWDLTDGWNRIEVPSGQAGTISFTELELDTPMEFAVLVTERPVPEGRLARKIDPLAIPDPDPQRHRVVLSGAPTGGTWTLVNDAADETTALAYNATAVAVQAAVRGLGGVHAGVSVTKVDTHAWLISMNGAEGDLDAGDNSLTGNGTQSMSVTTTGPSTDEGTPWFRDEAILKWLERYGFVIGWGSARQPAGYSPGVKTNPDTGVETGDAITGRLEDVGSYGYDCGLNGTTLNTYVWVGGPNKLQRQRVFHQQLDGSGT